MKIKIDIMYPLFYREYSYIIKITVDEFIQRMDDDLFETSSNAYRHEKQDHINKYIPFKGEINKRKNKITGIGLNASARGQTTANIDLGYNIIDNRLNVTFSFRESFLLFLISNLVIYIFIFFIFPLKGVLIFLMTFYPVLLFRYIHPFFSDIKTITRTFEEYLSKNKIEYEKVKVVKYSILDFVFKKVKE